MPDTITTNNWFLLALHSGKQFCLYFDYMLDGRGSITVSTIDKMNSESTVITLSGRQIKWATKYTDINGTQIVSKVRSWKFSLELELTKITICDQSHNISSNYKSEKQMDMDGPLPPPRHTGGGVRCVGGWSILCWLVTSAVSPVYWSFKSHIPVKSLCLFLNLIYKKLNWILLHVSNLDIISIIFFSTNFHSLLLHTCKT
jgi:hypothetical protein